MNAPNPTLILIDVQKGFCDSYWGKRNNSKAELVISKLLFEWRKRHLPIFHIQHLSNNLQSPLRPNQPGVDFMEFINPQPEEILIQKSVNSAFIGTRLELKLRNSGISDLVFVGFTSDHCVSTSTRMAANLGFRCFVVSDATVAFSRKSYDGKMIPADLVHQINLASLHGEFAEVINSNSIDKGPLLNLT